MEDLSERLRFIVRHAYANAPAVRGILEQAGLEPDDIKNLEDLGKIPVTSKDELAKRQAADPPFGGFLAVPLVQLEHVFLSPGPLYEPHAGETALYETIETILTIAGFQSGDVALNAFGYHLIPTGLAMDEVLRRSGITVIPAGVGNAELQIKMMVDLGVTAFVGTPSWLMALLEKSGEMGVDFHEVVSLRKALVSAEPLPQAMRQTFEETYNLSITNAYGTAELGFLAFNTTGGLAMRLLETSIIEVVNPETGKPVAAGEVGEVVVTSFNETYPLIRLGTGDMAMNVDPNPGKSRQGERSIILVGRLGEAVKVRGMFVHPNQLRFAMAQLQGIARYQAVVSHTENRDQLTIRLALADEAADHQKLSSDLVSAVQSACRVKVDQIEFVSSGEIGENAPLIVDERAWD